MCGIDKCAVGNRECRNLRGRVWARVGVGPNSTEGRLDILTISPGNEEEAVRHGAPEGDGGPFPGIVDLTDELADKVGACCLREGDAEAEEVVGGEALEGDAGCGIGVGAGALAIDGGDAGEAEGRRRGEGEAHVGEVLVEKNVSLGSQGV